jgi:hypothetical protein
MGHRRSQGGALRAENLEAAGKRRNLGRGQHPQGPRGEGRPKVPYPRGVCSRFSRNRRVRKRFDQLRVRGLPRPRIQLGTSGHADLWGQPHAGEMGLKI